MGTQAIEVTGKQTTTEQTAHGCGVNLDGSGENQSEVDTLGNSKNGLPAESHGVLLKPTSDRFFRSEEQLRQQKLEDSRNNVTKGPSVAY